MFTSTPSLLGTAIGFYLSFERCCKIASLSRHVRLQPRCVAGVRSFQLRPDRVMAHAGVGWWTAPPGGAATGKGLAGLGGTNTGWQGKAVGIGGAANHGGEGRSLLSW